MPQDRSANTLWVVKIGSALITNDGRGLDREGIREWVRQMSLLRRRGIDVALVSSGAVAEGMSRLGWAERPHALHELQAAASVGQMGLVQMYETCFQTHGLQTAQVLLTHEDLADRRRYLNSRSTLCTLRRLGVVPVINENDAVATDEIRLGDNDTLAGLVANLLDADRVVLLTDQTGLYDGDPRRDASAKLISEGLAGDEALLGIAGAGGKLGRGGMRTKLTAAALAARSGTETVIVGGRETDVLPRLAEGESVGTLLRPGEARVTARKRWMAGHLKPAGSLQLDEGAVRVLVSSGRSLLAVGVRQVNGEFERGELISCLDTSGREFARGLINYSSTDTRRIMGVASERIESVLGYVDEAELIHRDNLVLTQQ